MKKVISATEFMQQNAACERSVLVPFADDILLLKDNGYTDKQVLLFLEMNGVKVAQSTLNQFIKKKRQQSRVSGSLKRVNAVEVTPPQPQTEQSPAVTSQVDNAPVRRGLRKPTPTKKFNWNEKIDPETLKAPPAAPENTEIDRHPINTGFKKFNSREQRDIDDLI